MFKINNFILLTLIAFIFQSAEAKEDQWCPKVNNRSYDQLMAGRNIYLMDPEDFYTTSMVDDARKEDSDQVKNIDSDPSAVDLQGKNIDSDPSEVDLQGNGNDGVWSMVSAIITGASDVGSGLVAEVGNNFVEDFHGEHVSSFYGEYFSPLAEAQQEFSQNPDGNLWDAVTGAGMKILGAFIYQRMNP